MTAATRPPPDPREWGSAREMTAVEALMWRA
ncbi:MAG: hypothetical protein QOE18_1143, partial [Chloroflexota bacterium]|nr:hypothetical protein [Chloroflexota bacterium]